MPDEVWAADVVVGVGATPGAVDELIDDHELPGVDVGLERTDRARSDHAMHADRVHDPHVRPVWDPMRGELVVASVAGDERDRAAVDGTDRDRARRRPVRGGDLDDLGIIEEIVESGATEHAPLGLRRRRHVVNASSTSAGLIGVVVASGSLRRRSHRRSIVAHIQNENPTTAQPASTSMT